MGEGIARWVGNGRTCTRMRLTKRQRERSSLVSMKASKRARVLYSCRVCLHDHSVARYCLHCCKGEQLYLWRSAKLRVSELQNP